MANWYVRKTGSDNNGGSSSGASPDRSGSDMSTTNGNTQVTSATAAFGAGDANKGINIGGVCYRIATFTNSTTIQLDRNYAGTTGVNRTWAIGGAVLTASKLPNSPSTVVQGGDSIYIGAGTYREQLVIGFSASSDISIIGDYDGVQTGDAGEVIITNYTTNDKTASAGSTAISIGGRNHWALSNLTVVAGTGNPKILGSNDATNLTFTNCTFLAHIGANTTALSHAFTTASNHAILYDRCRFYLTGGISITLPTVGVADYDAGFVFKNCIIDAFGVSVDIGASGALTNKGGGVLIYNSFIRCNSNPAYRTSSANLSTTTPCKMENCILIGSTSTGLSANTSGQITEDYNIISAATPRANVTAGVHSISDNSYALMFDVGQTLALGMLPRPQFMPTASSPLLGFGSSGNGPTIDILGVTRPAGGASANYAVGPYERSNTWVNETSTVHNGSNAYSITGPGYHDFPVPINNTSTSITAFMRYDSTYAGTRPQITVLNGTQIGVANQSVTATTSALNAWELETITINPTASGWLTVRIISSDTNGGGKAFFDSANVQ